MTDQLVTERRGRVLVVRLNRPDARNALKPGLLAGAPEISRYAERFRAAQLEAVTSALTAHGITEDQLPPIVALLLMTGVSQVLALEDALGVTSGHDTTLAFVEQAIGRAESWVRRGSRSRGT